MATKLPTPKERDVQDAIVAALRLAGLHVMHTSAFKQKGPSGLSKGIPDLLVSIPGLSYCFLGLEVKRPGRVKWSCKEQEENHLYSRVALVQTPSEALNYALEAVDYTPAGHTRGRIARNIRAIARSLENGK